MEVLSLGEAISTRWIPKTQVRAIRAREIHEPTIKFLNIAVIEMEQMKSEESAEHLPSCIVKIDGLNEMNVLHFAQMMIYQDKWRRRIDEERDKHLPFRARSDSSEDENACTIPLTMIFDNPQAIIFPSGRIYSLLEIHIVTEHKVSDQLMPITRSLYNDAEIIHGEHQLSFGTMSFAALYREKQQIKLRCSFEINKSISENITSTN